VKRSSLRLEPFGREDFDRLIGWIPDARLLLQWAGPGYTFPLDAAQLEANQRDAEGEPPRKHLFKAVRDDGAVAGHIEIALPEATPRNGRLCRVLVSPDWQGRGYGLRLVRLACDVAFDRLDLDGVDLWVFEFNEAAIRTYEHVGFAATDDTKTAEFEGERWPARRMSLTRKSWRTSTSS
jgi:RimJ/RimL family protein N-acetyltransferase